MCGIFGILGRSCDTAIKACLQQSRNRGPNDNGIYKDEENLVVLGHTRLSIIDLSNYAHQPMADKNQEYILSFNGEIYNFRELRQQLEKLGHKFLTDSDTEVVLHSYIEWGEDCVKFFRGMFAFCIYDKKKRELFLSRDRFGIKPLIYTFQNGQFIFSSELKPLLKSGLILRKLSKKAVSDYFRYGAVRQPNTIFENVFCLMPGHSMRVDLEQKQIITNYYNLIDEAAKAPRFDNYEDAVKALRTELEIATKYHMVADVEVGAFLSGGIDSTACVSLMKQFSNKSINTYSVGFAQKVNVIDEVEYAEKTAKKLGTNHFSIRINEHYVNEIFDGFLQNIDQPTIDGINTYIVSRETAKELKVAISGLGGDELFAGYPHFKNIKINSGKKQNLLSKLGLRINNIRSNKFTHHFRYVGTDAETALAHQRMLNVSLEKILKNPFPSYEINFVEELSLIQNISKAEVDGYLLSTLLRDCDNLSMANSLEVRPVLLDHKLAELSFSIEDDYKIHSGRQKAIFIDAVKDLIPEEVWRRKKAGFEMPFASWMNGILNDRFAQVAHLPETKSIFHDEFLSNLHERINQKSLKDKDWLYFIFLSWFDLNEVEI